jgi:RNA polymerase sigma factor (sigma-70 family)
MSDPVSSNKLFEPSVYAAGHTRTWNESWQRLYDAWSVAIVAFSVSQGLNHQSAQNVCQEAMISLLRSQNGQAAGHDSGKGNFSSWLWGVVRNRIRSERRRHEREVLGSHPSGESEPEAGGYVLEGVQAPRDVGAAEEEAERQAVWVAALERVKQRVKPENFEIYRALIEERAGPDELAKTYGKTTNNIYAIKHRCDDLLIHSAQSIWDEQRPSRK